MKATFVNSILIFLFVSAFAEKNSIEPPLQRHYYYPEQLSPEAVNQSNNENTVDDKRSITKGRIDESPCGEEGNSHHYHPVCFLLFYFTNKQTNKQKKNLSYEMIIIFFQFH